MQSASTWGQVLGDPVDLDYPWKIGDGFDWSAAFSHNPYDALNPLETPDVDAAHSQFLVDEDGYE